MTVERVFIKKNMNKMEIEDYLSEKLERAGFSKLEIIKTPLVTRIVLYVAKPGLAIGKSGSTIKELTEKIASEYSIDNPQIEIQEIKQPNLDAKILARKMASMIESGFAWRSISYKMIKDIMEAGAQGVELVVKGKLSGKGGRKRKQRVAIGYLKKRGYQSRYVDKSKTAAYPKAGAIGITLSIIHPETIFPDKVDVKEAIKKLKSVAKEKEEQKEVVEEKKESTDEEEIKAEVKEEHKETKKEHKKEEVKVIAEIKKEIKEEGKVEEKKAAHKEKEAKLPLIEETIKTEEDTETKMLKEGNIKAAKAHGKKEHKEGEHSEKEEDKKE